MSQEGATPPTERVQALLHDVALELLGVPMQGEGRELHLRALRLKRQLSGSVSDAETQEALRLYRDVREYRLRVSSSSR